MKKYEIAELKKGTSLNRLNVSEGLKQEIEKAVAHLNQGNDFFNIDMNQFRRFALSMACKSVLEYGLKFEIDTNTHSINIEFPLKKVKQ